MMRNRPALLIVLLLVAMAAAVAVAMLRPAPARAPTVMSVASELYCPLCAGLTVDVCELEVCADMRETIGEKLAAGETPEQIQAYFVEQYGQKVLAKPATEGFHLTAWLMPFAFLLAALAAVWAWLRSRATPAPAAVRTTPSTPYDARLERELQRMEE